MEGISDIRIIGTDEKRPPRILKEPYIDIFFTLSHQCPLDWCRAFNELMASTSAKPKIDEKEGLFVNAWVRKPDEIVGLLEFLKESIAECNRQYIERVELSIRNAGDANAAKAQEEEGEQGRLNKIIAGLVFDEPQ
ncbi:MAG: hypothetical protein OEY67_07715 [Gammaproteobacteria bacterium]|nr:hypothetical protein [Gammaproteobacteria bacterium]